MKTDRSFSSLEELDAAGFGYREFDISHPRWEIWRVSGRTVKVIPDAIVRHKISLHVRLDIAEIDDIMKYATPDQPYQT